MLVSFLAAAIGLVAGLVAYALYKLIGLFTNLFFFHEWSTTFRSVGSHHLGAWVILVPVVGGLIVGVMAKYGRQIRARIQGDVHSTNRAASGQVAILISQRSQSNRDQAVSIIQTGERSVVSVDVPTTLLSRWLVRRRKCRRHLIR